MLAERPKGFIPVEDQGYLITAIQTPDGTGREVTSRVAASVAEIARGIEAYDLQLLHSVDDAGEIATSGKRLMVVAVIDRVIHIRIFDGEGKQIVDTNERRLSEKTRDIEELRDQLRRLWPPRKLSENEKHRVMHTVNSIVDHPLIEGVSDVVLLEGFNVLNSTNQTNSATAFVVLKDWSERTMPELRALALSTKLQAAISAQIRGAVVAVLEPPPIRGLSQTGGFEFMIEDREGKGVGALALITDRFFAEARKQPELGALFTPFTVNVPQIRFKLDRTKAQRLDVSVSDVFTVLQTYLGGYYVNDFNLYGKVWKVMVQAEGSRRITKTDIEHLYVLNGQGDRVPLDALGDAVYALGPIDVPHYNMYNAAKITGQPAAGYSSGQAIAAMERVADLVLPEGFSYEWTGTTFQEQKTGSLAMFIFALSIVCVFLFMAALYESWIRPLVIILTVPLAMFGAMIGLWIYDMPLDVFGQIGLVMLIGLETKNAILVVEFGVELQEKHGMSIIDSAKEASRQRLRPILMTSFAFIMGVLPMARATGAGAYSRNSLGVVIASGMLVSTVLGRFVIPIYLVMGERVIQWSRRRRGTDPAGLEASDPGQEKKPRP
jgi:multidrug efflux pump subunit AcrB